MIAVGFLGTVIRIPPPGTAEDDELEPPPEKPPSVEKDTDLSFGDFCAWDWE